MNNLFPINAPLTVVWHFTKPDGSPFSLNGYTYRLYYRSGKGKTEVQPTAVTADGDTLSFNFPADAQRFPGQYSLQLVLFQNGNIFCTLNYNDAFAFSRFDSAPQPSQTQETADRTIHLFTAAEYYLFTPVIPVVGTDGYWYVNGVKVTDGSGEPVPSSHTVVYDPESNNLIIDQGRVDSHGQSIEQVVTSIAQAVAAEAVREENEQHRIATEGRMQGLIDSIVVNFLADTDVYEQAVEQGFVGTREEWLASPFGVKGVGIASWAIAPSLADSGITTHTITLNNGDVMTFNVKNGRGIKSIKQTAASQQDGGTNIITVTMSDGSATNFQVLNGSQGNSGYSGAAGELEVVNNLYEGGATAALSAEQGKNLNADMGHLNQKLRGISLEEMDIPFTPDDGYVKSSDGTIGSFTGSEYIEVEVEGAEKVRFLGVLAYNTTFTSGYAFGKYVNDEWVTVSSAGWSVDTSLLASTVKDYLVSVPSGATHFRTTSATASVSALADGFYCCLQNGQPAVGHEEFDAFKDSYKNEQGPLYRITVQGGGNALRYSGSFSTILPGHKYRIYIKSHDINGTTFGDTNAKFIVYSQDALSVSTKLVEVLRPDPFAQYYEFTVPDDSIKVFLGIRAAIGTTCEYYVDDISTQNEKMMQVTFTESGYDIRSSFDAARDLLIHLERNSIGRVDYDFVYVGPKGLSDTDMKATAYRVSNTTDIIPPLRTTDFWQLFSNYGWAVPKMTVSSHNLDETDINSIWKDQNGKQFFLGSFGETEIVWIPVTSQVDGTYYTASWKQGDAFPTTMTHVSGATHTEQIAGTCSRSDLSIQTMEDSKVFVDGDEVNGYGTWYCDELRIVERVAGNHPALTTKWFPYEERTFNGVLADFSRTYTFKGSSMTANVTYAVKTPYRGGRFDGMQPQMPIKKGDYHSYTIIPKVKKKYGGNRMDIPFVTDSTGAAATDISRTASDLYDVDKQPDRILTFLKDDSGNYLAGAASGLSLLRGMSGNAERNANIPGSSVVASWDPSLNNKLHFRVLANGSFEGGIVPDTFICECTGYYSWFNPAENPDQQVYWYKDGNSYVVYAHCQQAFGRVEINLPAFMEGLAVTQIVEKTEGASLLTKSVSSGRLYASYDTSADTANYIVFALEGTSDNAHKDTSAEEGNVAVFDGEGNPVDGGKAISSFLAGDNISHAAWKTVAGEKVTLADNSVAGSDLLSDLLLDGNLFNVKTITQAGEMSIRSRSIRPNGTYGDLGYYHSIIYVKPGDIIRLKQSGSGSTYCAFFKEWSFASTNNIPLPLVDGTTVQTVGRDSESILRVPEGAVGLAVYLGSYDSETEQYALIPAKIEIFSPKNYEQEEGVMSPITANGYIVSSSKISTDTSRNARAYPMYPGYKYVVKMVSSGTTVTDYFCVINDVPVTGMDVSQNGTRSNAQGMQRMFTVDEPSFLLIASAAARLKSVTAYKTDPAKDACANADTLVGTTMFETPNLTKSSNYILSSRGYWVTDSSYCHYLVPINGEKWLKITAQSDSVSRYAFLTGTGNNSDNVAKFTEGGGINVVAEGATEIVSIPSDAVYLYIYYGPSSSYTGPSFVGLSSGIPNAAGDGDSFQAQTNDLRSKLAVSAAVIGLYPLERTLDENGWEVPRTLQQKIVVEKCNQMSSVQWTPKSIVYGKTVDYAAGTTYNGIPYSSNMQDFKHVGIEVSIHTFMTAANNPYSVLYTEVIGGSHKTSIWGRSYDTSNGYGYYGTVCCGLTSGAVGAYTKYHNTAHDDHARYLGTFRPLGKPKEINWALMEIGDIFDDDSHSCIIVGIKRDSSGNIVKVKECESVAGQSAAGRCKVVEYTPSNFQNFIGPASGGYKMVHYKYSPLYNNIEIEDASAYVSTAGVPVSTPTYNEDICTIYGDKACLAKGDLVVLNYNLTATPAHTWTAIEVYKDGDLLDTFTLANIVQSELPEGQRNHALELGTTLDAGQYKARLTDGTNYSDYTYWEILPQDITITKLSDGVYKVKNTASVEMVHVYLGDPNANEERTFNRPRCGRPLEFYERLNGEFILYAKDLIKEFGVTTPNVNRIRIMQKGEYGLAASATIPLE